MTLAEVGRAGQQIDLLRGGDVAPDGRLLSVQEIQERFRQARARGTATARMPSPRTVQSTDDVGTVMTKPADATTNLASAAAPPRPQLTRGLRLDSAGEANDRDEFATLRGLRLDGTWVRVLAGHSGAGASTVALAIADAAAATGRQVLLVEAAHPSRSGLVAASSVELGLDGSGAWLRGTRGQPALVGQVTIARRVSDVQPHAWPVRNDESMRAHRGQTGEPTAHLMIIDLGLVPVDVPDTVAHHGCPVVIVGRATVPGARRIEQLLEGLDGAHAVVAMLGSRRWPGEVDSSAGPRLRALRDADRLVTVPFDRRLETSGPTPGALPKSVLTAGRELLGALRLADAARPVKIAG